jgi:MazG family protein
MIDAQRAGEKFQELVDILAALRGPQGCPWDKEQTETSIADYFLEEVYEALDALREGDREALAEELGDVLMEVVFLAWFGEEKREFTIADALEGINRKMIRRHPHVFGGEKAESAERVLDAWVRRKKEEKGRASQFEGIPSHAPALLAALQIGNRAAAVGFDWPTAAEALRKVHEELAELEEAMGETDPARVEEELGDCFFALANVARKLKLNPELALRRGNAKFIRRFTELESALAAEGREPGRATLEEMEAVWQRTKR